MSSCYEYFSKNLGVELSVWVIISLITIPKTKWIKYLL